MGGKIIKCRFRQVSFKMQRAKNTKKQNNNNFLTFVQNDNDARTIQIDSVRDFSILKDYEYASEDSSSILANDWNSKRDDEHHVILIIFIPQK